MPRMMRFEHPGSLVHIMARGIDKQPIVIDNEDKIEFLKRFAQCLSQVGYRCLSWCLMRNNYHLFLRTTENPMSSLMRSLNGGYARWFNKKYKDDFLLYKGRRNSTSHAREQFCYRAYYEENLPLSVIASFLETVAELSTLFA